MTKMEDDRISLHWLRAGSWIVLVFQQLVRRVSNE